MDENKNLLRRDDDDLRRNDSDDDQLRGNTANEAIREVHGGPDADISGLNDGDQQGGLGRMRGDQDLHGSDTTQGMSYDPNDSSAVRSGGTTDMDNQTASGGTGLAGLQRGAGTNIDTKRNVTGSDFDGQNATS